MVQRTDPSQAVTSCGCVLGEDAEPSVSATPRQRFLFEGQLTVEEPPRSLAANAVDELLAAVAEAAAGGAPVGLPDPMEADFRSPPGPLASRETARGMAQAAIARSAAAASAAASADVQDVARARIVAALAALAAAHGEDGDTFDGMEQALAASLADGGRSRAPPASRRAVSELRTETLLPDRLLQMGAVLCSVCRDELAAGDTVQVMPCKHVFHPPCLAPWLECNNTCPVCRFELPTDDPKYEAAKARAAELAEEALGSANALAGGEFHYI